MNSHLAVYVTLLFVATGFLLMVGLFVLRFGHRMVSILFMGVMVLASLWSAAQAFYLLSDSTTIKIVWLNLRITLITFLPILWLWIALEYTQQINRINRAVLVALLIIPAITIVLAWTLSPLFRLDYRLVRSVDISYLYFKAGPWTWVHIIYSYILMLLAIYLLIRFLRQVPGIYVGPIIGLIICMSIPAPFDLLYNFGLSPIPQINLASITFIITGPITAWVLFSYRTLKIIPIAQKNVVDNIMDPILIIDQHNQIVDLNRAAQKMTGYTAKQAIGLQPGRIIEKWPSLASDADSTESQVYEYTFGEGRDTRTYETYINPLLDPYQHLLGKIILLRDISIRKQIQHRLEEQVLERTAALEQSVRSLEIEATERQNIVSALSRSEETLSQRVADQSRKMAALYEVTLVGTYTSELSAIFSEAISLIVATFKSDFGCIHISESHQNLMVLAASRGMDSKTLAPILNLPGSEVPRENIPINIPDLQFDTTLPVQMHIPGCTTYLGAVIFQQEKQAGILSLYWKLPNHFLVEDIALLRAMADQLGLLSEITNLRRQIESTAAQKERRRLARDLHDSVTQSLHSLVLAADTATHRLKQGRLEKLETSLDQLSEAARQALKEMRLLLFELRLAPKSEVDLIEMIQARLETVEKRAGVEGTLEHEPEAQWPRGWNDELYPIMMESMNNSLKHARATRLLVRITTSQTPGSIRFEVIDNGVGFSLDQLPPGGMGIISIKERAERLGAQLNIDSSPGQGTTVRVTVPI